MCTDRSASRSALALSRLEELRQQWENEAQRLFRIAASAIYDHDAYGATGSAERLNTCAAELQAYIDHERSLVQRIEELRAKNHALAGDRDHWKAEVQNLARAHASSVTRFRLDAEAAELRIHDQEAEIAQLTEAWKTTSANFAVEYQRRQAAEQQVISLTQTMEAVNNAAARVALDHRAQIAALTQQIDLFWEIVENGWDIEPREFFENEAPTNGFKSPLAQAAHHMWKRDPKVQALTQQVEDLKNEKER